jgi:hypothetical protein
MKTNDVKASCNRYANGWGAVLEYSNGGRQLFSQRFGTMEDAVAESNHLIRMRDKYPQEVISDPAPNACQIVGEHARNSTHSN